MNSNITGSGNFSFTVATGALNKITLTLTNSNPSALTDQKSYINIDLDGIRNPTASMEFGTDGYRVDVATKTVGGGMMLQTLRSSPIFIQQAGANTLTVQLKDPSGANIAVANLLVRLNGPAIGMIEGFTNGAGQAIFDGLNNGDYYVFTDPTVMDQNHQSTDYLGNPMPLQIKLAGNQGVDMRITNATTDVTLKTLTIAVAGLPVNESVIVWASSPQGYFEKRISADGAGAIAATMKLKADRWQVGVRPDFGDTTAASMMNFVQPGWQPPLPKEVDLSTTNGNYSETIKTANRILTVTVTDGTNPIPKASVWAYNPGGSVMGSNGMTDTDGIVRLKLMDGSYTIGAYVEGLPPIPETSTVISGNKSLTIVVKKPNLQISGKILSGNVGIQNAGVYAYQVNSTTDTTPAGSYANSMTDTNGSYKLFVNENTVWKVGAFAPGIGMLDEQIVSIGSASVTQNFLASSVTLYDVSGTVANLPTNTVANIWAESTEAGDYYGNFTTTDSNGAYSLQLKSGKTYKIHAFVPVTGELGTLTT